MRKTISIVIPAKNEANSLRHLLPVLRKISLPSLQIIVVDDGSEDDTQQIAQQFADIVIRHPISHGNGAAIKRGVRAATGEILIFMDADGQHRPEDIPRLLEKLFEGYDMIVGARQSKTQSWHRAVANWVYNRLASWVVDDFVEDLTSGFRVVYANKFRQFLYLLPNGFSYPTTITISFFRAGYSVGYIPIYTQTRLGKSHIRLLSDGIRFFIIIFKITTLHSPLKIFIPMSLLFLILGITHYFYTLLTEHRFTNMSALLFITSILIFLIGLISEQITYLNYKNSNETDQ